MLISWPSHFVHQCTCVTLPLGVVGIQYLPHCDYNSVDRTSTRTHRKAPHVHDLVHNITHPMSNVFMGLQ